MTTDLLPRLSAATGPSRELDAEIALANGWKVEPLYISIATSHFYWKSPTGQICPNPPRYTESIEAALTLVPEGWRVFELSEWDGIEPCGWHCRLRRKNESIEVSAGWPNNWPLLPSPL